VDVCGVGVWIFVVEVEDGVGGWVGVPAVRTVGGGVGEGEGGQKDRVRGRGKESFDWSRSGY